MPIQVELVGRDREDGIVEISLGAVLRCDERVIIGLLGVALYSASLRYGRWSTGRA
jgi:hypothetical protein